MKAQKGKGEETKEKAKKARGEGLEGGKDRGKFNSLPTL